VLLTPRYDGPSVLRLEPPGTDLAVPLVRQRRRLAAVLAGLEPRQWESPSRCEAWSVRDVVAHLVRTNQMWHISITAALAGEPTRLMHSFDPVANPARQVEAMRGWTSQQALDRFVETAEALADVVTGLDLADWSLRGETPLGHVGVDLVALHGLWDCWIHERDILLPLGIAPDEEPDEVLACLRYAAALGPALLATHGSTRRGTVAITATDPDAHILVEAGPTVVIRDGEAQRGEDGEGPDAVHLAGPAVYLVEALTLRTELPAHSDHWLLTSLAEAFDALPTEP
jgi:uncharacterized protein (TIGR03083 family)